MKELTGDIYGTCGWEILHACNYRCPYCFFIPSWKEDLVNMNRKHLRCSPDDWLVFWRKLRRSYGSFLINISGGEPFEYPGFAGLVGRISEQHLVRITTNLSWSTKEAVGVLNSGRVSFTPSFHPHFADLEIFAAKAIRLQGAGFAIRIVVVAYPAIFERLSEYRDAFRDRGLPTIFAPFQGRYQGRSYPGSYSEKQRRWLDAARGEEPLAFSYSIRDRDPFGRLCAAGARYFRAYPDGRIYRCIPVQDLPDSEPLGNIRDRDFTLAEGPARCPAHYCGCISEYRNLLEMEGEKRLRPDHDSGVRLSSAGLE